MTEPSLLIVGTFLLSSLGTRSVSDDLSARLSARGWRVLTTSDRLSRTARLCDMLLTCWKKRDQYDVALVEVYSGPAFYWAESVCWLLRQIGKPYVLTLHGGDLPAFARRWKTRVRRQLNWAAAVTTPSRYLLEEMRSYRSDLCLLPNCLDISAYPFRLRDQVRPELVWLRKFHHVYNPPLAPQVLALLSTEFPDARLTMTGPDKGDGSLAEVRRTAQSLGVADRLCRQDTAATPEVPWRLNQGDIYLNTTDFDNTPVSVLEAMACGLCVVSTNVGGIPFLLEHEHDALLVPPRNPEAMAAAVRRILLEPGLARRLSEAGRRKVEAFDWSKVMPRWEQLLSSVASVEPREELVIES